MLILLTHLAHSSAARRHFVSTSDLTRGIFELRHAVQDGRAFGPARALQSTRTEAPAIASMLTRRNCRHCPARRSGCIVYGAARIRHGRRSRSWRSAMSEELVGRAVSGVVHWAMRRRCVFARAAGAGSHWVAGVESKRFWLSVLAKMAGVTGHELSRNGRNHAPTTLGLLRIETAACDALRSADWSVTAMPGTTSFQRARDLALSPNRSNRAGRSIMPSFLVRSKIQIGFSRGRSVQASRSGFFCNEPVHYRSQGVRYSSGLCL